MSKKAIVRTSQGLRDVLFDELQDLRAGKSEPSKAMAVANLAKQIVSTAKAEMEFHRTMHALEKDGREVAMGALQLGS